VDDNWKESRFGIDLDGKNGQLKQMAHFDAKVNWGKSPDMEHKEDDPRRRDAMARGHG
jgi:hypothetical protein